MKKFKTLIKIAIVGSLVVGTLAGCQSQPMNEEVNSTEQIELAKETEADSEKTSELEGIIEIDQREMISGYFDGEFPTIILNSEEAIANIAADELLVIALEENPSTGYHWEFEEKEEIKTVKDTWISDSKEENIVGSGGIHYYGFKVAQVGQYTLEATLKSPAGETQETKIFEINITEKMDAE